MRILSLILLSFLFFLACGDDAPEDEMPLSITVSIDDITFEEGENNSNLFVRLQLNTAADKTITAIISTADGTAEAGEDYEALNSAPVVFNTGDRLSEIPMQILGDEDPESDETFTVSIVSVDGGVTINKGSATITLLNDDQNDATVVIPTTGTTSPLTYPNMDLLWQDEFDNSEIDPNTWTFEIGTGSSGWGNNEWQFYRKENAWIQEGSLVIQARNESFGGSQYTSTRMITKNKFDFQYGRVDIRASLPSGQGIWPALWMLGDNISSVGWPACGEIDIMEIVGHEPNKVHGTIHWSNNGDHAQYGGSTTMTQGNLQDEFHVYSIIWDSQRIQWLLDDQVYHSADITPGQLSEFHEEFFFIFNVAVGGNWPGYPDGSTVFPQRMIVDYIRVFQ